MDCKHLCINTGVSYKNIVSISADLKRITILLRRRLEIISAEIKYGCIWCPLVENIFFISQLDLEVLKSVLSLSLNSRRKC